MFVRLIPFFVAGMIVTIGFSDVTAGVTYFRTGFQSPFNGTSWRTSVPLQSKSACVIAVPRNSSFSATRSVRYAILGSHGVRLVDGPGAIRFFSEEPTGNYTIIRNGNRISYRHIADDKQTWRASLNDVLAGEIMIAE